MADPKQEEPTWRLIYGEEPQFVKPETRIYFRNIPSDFSEGRLALRLRKMYGPVQIHFFCPGENDDGYAWVGFEEERSVRKAMQLAPKDAEEPQSPTAQNLENNTN